MLNRAEDTGGNRTTRLTRGLPTSPGPVRASPRPTSRRGSEATTPKDAQRLANASSTALESTGLLEFFQQDDRPIFVLDLEAVSKREDLPIAFVNAALRQKSTLYDAVCGRSEDTSLLLDLSTPFTDFRTWLLSDTHAQGMISAFPFCGVLWKSTTLWTRFKVVSSRSDHVPEPRETGNGRRSSLQAHRLLSSPIASQKTSSDRTVDQPGYFDIRPATRTSTTSHIMQGLVTGSTDELTSPNSLPAMSSGGAPTSNGDSGMQEMLITPASPVSEFKKHFMPKKSNPETLQPMSMDYLTDRGFFDWTRLPLTPSLPDHIHFARSFNWARTSLGPIEEWSADLRAMCNLIMASPHPAAMYWGPEHVAIYNEPYVMLAGQKHPDLMGSRYQDIWAEIWDVIEDVFTVAMRSAQATMKDDDCLFLIRNGFLEETYFSWSIIPLIGDDGTVVGLYNPAFEKTRRKIAERRMLTLREIGEQTGAARAVSQFWSLLLEGFKYNELDAPLVIVYSLNDAEDSEVMSSTSSTAAALKQCRLEGALGVDAGHACAPEAIDLKHDSTGWGKVFKQAIMAETPVILSTEDGSLDPKILEGIVWRGFGEPSKILVVSPIRPTSGESTLGFLIMGTNPRRPYDEDYDLFVQLLGRQLATSIASVVLFEEEIKKGEKAAQMAARDRMELSNQLAIRTAEAVESENKFTRMAELAPVGMFIGDSLGQLTFANEAWYQITGFPRGQFIGYKWADYVSDLDRDTCWNMWQKLLKHKVPITVEFRWKKLWRDQFGNKDESWSLASASPEFDADGNIRVIYGSVTEISSQKLAETMQRKRMEEALETKRQQERYIDTTSHEMRNPLSAILQSADSITSTLTDLRADMTDSPKHLEVIDQVIESSQTITLCAQHQKRIVDDVLTLSKLDSAMLLVTPIDVQPVMIARRAVKMFEGELQTADIALDIRIDRSYQALAVDWVRLDPTRLSQVLINLMTNAIKFTTTQEKRIIRMHLAASKEKPSQEDKWKLTYINSLMPKDKDVTAAPEWGLGEAIYIHFAVQDTGRGLNEQEKKQLFQRFSQANPKTHVTYGGSGLGLFISRELVELQGGEIGVASESGKGSTFAFYVKGRRSQAPLSGSEDDADAIQTRRSFRNSNKTSKLNRVAKITESHASNLASSTVLASPRTTATQLSKSRTDATGLRVLIVEDNLINQKVLAGQLRKIGCVVSVANHGREAIEYIKKSTYYTQHEDSSTAIDIDVVLMDLEMPIMDGMTCARELRRMQLSGQLSRHIPVIAVTANAREEQIRDTLQSGIDDVVSKPFRIPELVPKMKDTIARFAQLSVLPSDTSEDVVDATMRDKT